ncbi:MAG TPA: energy transducer TonB [Bacteroidales bacterium]|nr:energy transducer TonB [Bacteroidales bacterium]HPE57713.1 energy transducer TonB [Bacteroidales bacterium]HRX97757.1 energy transducer TonB [Bacteroidales bacterium]
MRDSKKSKKADLESKKMIFIEIGLIIALAGVLLAFEWKSYEKQELDLGQLVVDDTPEEMVEITQQEKPPPPPPPQQQTTVIEIVEDDMEIEDEIEIDVEADQETVVEEYIPVEDDDEEEEEAQIFTVVESMPGFPGGETAMKRYLAENIQYPQMARESGIQGRVFVTFVVEKDGNVTDVRVLRGIGGGCDEEAIRVIKNMPRWDPGKQRGKPVRVQFNMPIMFKLN